MSSNSGSSTQELNAEQLPLLGEPLPVELCNTLYGEGEHRVDFLGDTSSASLWMSASGAATNRCFKLNSRELNGLTELRDSVRRLCVAAIADSPIYPGDVEVLNRIARQTPSYWQLTADGARGLKAQRHSDGTLLKQALATLAVQSVELLGGPQRLQLRRCPAPDCGMLFLQQHHRRRFCHESCSHRSRQAAYYKRQQARCSG